MEDGGITGVVAEERELSTLKLSGDPLNGHMG